MLDGGEKFGESSNKSKVLLIVTCSFGDSSSGPSNRSVGRQW